MTENRICANCRAGFDPGPGFPPDDDRPRWYCFVPCLGEYQQAHPWLTEGRKSSSP